MADFSYNIFSKNKNLTEFSKGNNWLIGLTAEKREQLLAKLTIFVETGNIDAQQIETIIAEFIEWFIDDYEKREKKECPFDENEIVESVGIVSINQSGHYSLYNYGKFKFYYANRYQNISESDYKGQLTDNDVLIANPKNGSINESILAIENDNTTENDAQKYDDFSYPFAIIRPERETIQIKPKPQKKFWLVSGLLSLVLITLLGWMNKSSISKYFAGLSVDSITVQSGNTRLVETATKEMNADDYFEKAEQSFDFAKSFMEDGKNTKAIQQLDSAAFYYRKVLQSDSSYKHKVQPKIDEINTRKSVLTSNPDL